MNDSVVPQRFAAGLLGFFAAVAVLLAAVGVYGVMAQAVSRRTHEIGVRMALGAQPASVQRMVVGQGLRMVGAGLALGLAAALALGRFTASVVPGAGALEPGTLAAAALGLLALATTATWLPARRATRVDPVIALREE